MAWSPDSKLWARGDESGYVAIYDTAGGENRHVQYQVKRERDGVVVFPDGTEDRSK